MAERSDMITYLESFDRVPEPLVRASRATDPLIRIAAGRVLRRVRWSGDATVEVAMLLEELRRLWQAEIEQQNFLPSPELHERLIGMLTSFEAKRPHLEPSIPWAIRRLGEGALDQTLTAEQMTAIESARMLLQSPPADNDRILPHGLELLPPPYLSVVVTALFARLRDETFTDDRSEMGFENELVPLSELRGRFVPDIDALFAVYLTFSGLVLIQWLGWLAKHDGQDPGWVSYSHLKISWQLASVASWVGLPALLAFLDRKLHGEDARQHFVALTFTELVIRIGRAGGQLQMYGGGSIAADVVVPEPGPVADHSAHLPVAKGSVLWNMPSTMRVARRERVEVRIGDEHVVEAQLREGLKGKGLQRIDMLDVYRTMRVALVADDKDFSIKTMSSLDQYLRDAHVARWDFDVVPLRAGVRVLRILVTMRLKIEGKDEVIDLASYEREVRVRVAPLHSTGLFLGKNWQWIAGTVAIPLAVWVMAHTEFGIGVNKMLGITNPKETALPSPTVPTPTASGVR